MFEKASRLKLRFNTERGLVTVEDLWDLPLTSRNGVSLDILAKSLNKQVKESEEESFVVEKNEKNRVLDLKFEIVKHIIKVKLEEREVEKKKADNKAKKEVILNIMAKKQNEELENKSIDELSKLLDQL